MALTPGTRLGPYEISAPIGVGGMGEVYQATDTNLKRDVAIKVLPAAVAADAERLARFQREAEVLAVLNHPNIAQIYGLQRSGGTIALVMELVEGPTLADRIAQGTIPIDEALLVAKQIAEALEAAHEQGIVHRDLKPANVKVRPDGAVKVLDFGLAKALDAGPGRVRPQPDQTASPTITTPAMTQAGMILGTAAYMSPEQARGRQVDKRTDIWAFGCVLYEMLAGRVAFPGDDVTDTLATVIRSEPDWSHTPANLHPDVRRLLKRCLEKDAAKRWHDIADVRVDIQRAIDDPGGLVVEPAVPTAAGVTRRSVLEWGAAALVGGAAGWMLRPTPSPGPTAVARLSLALPSGQVLRDNFADFDVSADGRFAYVSSGQLYLRELDDPEPRPLSGVTGAAKPFFSPDGQSIGFVSNGQLKKMATVGGVPQLLGDVGSVGMGASWGSDEAVYFAPSNSSGIWKVSASGVGDAEAVTMLDREAGEISHRSPQALPGGKAILFTVWTGPGFAEKRVEIQIFGTGERRVVAAGGNTGRFVSSGHVVYSLQGDQTLMAVPFDLEALRPTGPAVRLADAVAVGEESALYAVSPSGTLAYVAANPGRDKNRMAWINRDGTAEPIGPEGAYYSLQLSPTGRFVAVTSHGPVNRISIYDFSSSLLTPLPGDESSQFPVWHPDGDEIFYRGTRSGFRNVYRRAADGSGVERRLTTSGNLQTPLSFSDDGWLLLVDFDPSTGADLWKIRVEDEDPEPQAFHMSQEWESDARFSPDGRSVAYNSGPQQPQVFVVPFPEAEPRRLVGAGQKPVWSPDGRELYFVGPGDDQLFVADVSGSGTGMEVRNARVLLPDWPGIPSGPVHSHDVSPDGRFLAIVPVQSVSPPDEIIVVLNWHEQLRRLVPPV